MEDAEGAVGGDEVVHVGGGEGEVVAGGAMEDDEDLGEEGRVGVDEVREGAFVCEPLSEAFT